MESMNSTERAILFLDLQIMNLLPKKAKFFYKRALFVKPKILSMKSVSIWVGRFVFLLTIAYCAWCIFYVLSFAALKGPAVSSAWLFCFVFANVQDSLIQQPLKCFIKFVIVPILFINWLVKNKHLSIERVKARQRWMKLRAYVEFGLFKQKHYRDDSRILVDVMEEKEENLPHIAQTPRGLITIQARWRGFLVRRKMKIDQLKLVDNFSEHELNSIPFESHEQDISEEKICVNEETPSLKSAKEVNAAVAIQAKWRGFLVRRTMKIDQLKVNDSLNYHTSISEQHPESVLSVHHVIEVETNDDIAEFSKEFLKVNSARIIQRAYRRYRNRRDNQPVWQFMTQSLFRQCVS